jgi:uncharacterized repeat protein (TIGR01451 family)
MIVQDRTHCRNDNIHKQMLGLSILATLGIAVFVSLAQTRAAMAAIAPPLGDAGSFAVLGAAAVTNTGPAVVTGDLGLSPGSSITGFPPGTVSGTIQQTNAAAANAQTAATTAYNALAAQSCDYGPYGAADLAGMTLVPGVYCYSSTVQISVGGILTLDAQGNNNAVWIFKIGSTLTSVSGASIVFINGGQDCNVFWQVGSSATVGTNSTFVGTIIAANDITLNTGATVSGRILARGAPTGGAVTLDSNIVSVCSLAMPSITILKSVIAYSDPINGTLNPKTIPGSEMLYTIVVTNSGYGVADNGTTAVTEPIPANMSVCVSTSCSDPPVRFSCSVAPDDCGLTYTYAANVAYSNQAGGVAPYTYSVEPDTAGYDANVTGVRINPAGIFNGKNVGNTSFSLLLKMKIK